MNCILIMLIIWGCDKSAPNDNFDQKPRLVWKVDKGINKYDQISQDPVIYKDRLLIGYQTENDEGYVIYNKNNGSRIKEIKQTPSFEVFSQLNENVYYSSVGPRFRTIDLDNFQVSWHEVQNYGGFVDTRLTFYDDNILLPINSFHIKDPNFKTNKILIVQSVINDLKSWNILIEFEHQFVIDAFGTGLRPILVKKTSKGETIFYFTTVMGFHDIKTPAEYITHAYNATTKNFEWHSEKFMDTGILASKSLIHNDNLITNTGYNIISRNIKNGNINWKTNINEGISLSHTPILVNGKIISIDFLNSLHQIDASTGQILKKLNLGASGTMNWAFHNGIIYFTTAGSKLYAIDAETLTIKWELMSPNRDRCSYCTFGFESPVVDPETNRLYISDAWEVFCYELPQ